MSILALNKLKNPMLLLLFLLSKGIKLNFESNNPGFLCVFSVLF